jgi:hypothetical protein
MSDNSEVAFDWRYLDPVPKPEARVVADIRPDRDDPSDARYRAQCFLGKWYRDLAGMLPGSGRHNAVRNKARAAGGLVAQGLLSEAEAYEALYAACEANGLTQDPGGAAERTVRDGLSYGMETPWVPSDLPDSPVWRTRYESPRMGSKSRTNDSFTVPSLYRQELQTKFQTARELAQQALPEVAWIARPWVAEGGLTEVDGKVKAAGKTTWLLALIRCVLDGEPFMNQPTRQTPVVLLSEQGPRSLQQALIRAGLEERDDLHVLMWHETRQYKWPDVVECAADYCKEVGARLLAVDTLSQFVGLHGDSENSAGDALVAMQPLQAVIARDGLAIIFNRHERKSGGDVGDSGRGSSAYAGAVDIIISLRRAGLDVRPTVRHLHALSRFDETPAKTVIELQGVRYVALGDEETLASERAQQEVYSVLGAEDELLTALQIQEQVMIRRNVMYDALNALLASGQIRRVGSGKRGDAYRYFRPQKDDVFDV